VTLYTTVGNYLLQGLEDRFAKPQDPQRPECMIVLGGGFENEVNTTRHGIEMNAGGDRFIEALRLAQKYPQSRILVPGGDGSMSGVYEGDAVMSARFFPLFGVAKERMVEETTSRTTFENAVNTKDLLASQGLVQLPADHIRLSHAALRRHLPQARDRRGAVADGLPDRRTRGAGARLHPAEPEFAEHGDGGSRVVRAGRLLFRRPHVGALSRLSETTFAIW
jgi:hypothetical protein